MDVGSDHLSKSKRKRLRKKGKLATNEVVVSDQDGGIKSWEICQEHIEVMQTKGYKRIKRWERGDVSSDDSDDDYVRSDPFWSKLRQQYTGCCFSDFSGSSSEDDYYYDAFFGQFFSSSGSSSCASPRYCHGHQQHQYCAHHSYPYMKSKQNSGNERKCADSMSENVDGYVGDKSMDYIMDFLGEKQNISKAKKKGAKVGKKGAKQQQAKNKKVSQSPKTKGKKEPKKGDSGQHQQFENEEPSKRKSKDAKRKIQTIDLTDDQDDCSGDNGHPKNLKSNRSEHDAFIEQAETNTIILEVGSEAPEESSKNAQNVLHETVQEQETDVIVIDSPPPLPKTATTENSETNSDDAQDHTATATDEEANLITTSEPYQDETEATTCAPSRDRTFYTRVFINSNLRKNKGYSYNSYQR